MRFSTICLVFEVTRPRQKFLQLNAEVHDTSWYLGFDTQCKLVSQVVLLSSSMCRLGHRVNLTS